MCLLFCDIAPALQGLRVRQGHSRAWCVARSTISLQGSWIRSQRWPRDPQRELGVLATAHHHPYCLVTHCQGSCPSGVRVQAPGVGLHGLASSPVLSSLPRGEVAGGLTGQGPFTQHSLFPSSALGGRCSKARTSIQRETLWGNMVSPCSVTFHAVVPSGFIPETTLFPETYSSPRRHCWNTP